MLRRHDACALYSLPERARALSIARWLFACFSSHISGTQSFQENRHVFIHLLIVHNPLVPLIGRLVVCSARTRADRQTDGQTDRTTTVTHGCFAASAQYKLSDVTLRLRNAHFLRDNAASNADVRLKRVTFTNTVGRRSF